MASVPTRLRAEFDKLSEVDQLRALWLLKARPKQLPPDNLDWNVWLALAGRGWGKTESGANWFADKLLKNPGWRGNITAPTFGDAVDTCVEGETGLLTCLPEREQAHWNRSLGELKLTNGSRVKCYSAEKPDRMRGPQWNIAWCDELAAFRYPDAWDQMQFGLRLGPHPQTVVTTTPRPVQLVRMLRDRAGQDVVMVTGKTLENAANLPPSALAALMERYAGTRLGRQELDAEILEDVEGALWRQLLLDELRVRTPPELIRIIVAVDPAGSSALSAAETGIVVVGLAANRDLYVLADRSGHYSPDGWGRRAVTAYEEFSADLIVGEKNFGGDMVEHVVRSVDPNVAFKPVNASRGKTPRAEPIAALYEQGRVHHVGTFPDLEVQLTSWVQGEPSPDRLDALVWGCSSLMGKVTRKASSTAEVWSFDDG